MKFINKIRKFDFNKSIPKDLTQATYSGVICFLNSINFLIDYFIYINKLSVPLILKSRN